MCPSRMISFRSRSSSSPLVYWILQQDTSWLYAKGLGLNCLIRHKQYSTTCWSCKRHPAWATLTTHNLLSYPRPRIDASNLYQIPHFVIWPVQLHTQKQSILWMRSRLELEQAKKQSILWMRSRLELEQAKKCQKQRSVSSVSISNKTNLCLSVFECWGDVSIRQKPACWQWRISCLGIPHTVIRLSL